MKKSLGIPKLIAVLFSLFALLLIMTGIAFADGSCGANVTWALSDSGVLTIRGTGDMQNYRWSSDIPWHDSSDSITTVVVEEGVTSITDYAFYWCRNLSSVSLPSTLTSIGEYAFQNCNNLVSIQIPDSVTAIKRWTFYGCSKLSSVKLPGSLISIDELAFGDCSSLREVSLPASIASISDDRVFMGCHSLEKILIPDDNSSYVSVDGILFDKSETTLICYPAGKYGTEYTVPESVSTIASYGFYWNSNLTSITVPGSVKNIGSDAFAGCKKLTSITLGEGIESIGSTAFFRCESLTNIFFPASLVSLGDDAFEAAYKLTNISVAEESDTYASLDGVLFNKDLTTLIAYPAGIKKTSYSVPDTVTTIGDYAFLYNDSLSSITFPNGLTRIGVSAFSGCDQLTGITFPDTLVTIDSNAFFSCEGLVNITLPASVSILGYDSFGWTNNLVNTTILNPYVSFSNLGVFNLGNKNMTITGITGSTAEEYAKANGFRFIETNPATTESVPANGADSWICSECHSKMNGGKFCNECGAPRPTKQVCKNCGYEVEEGKSMKFCPECGTKFE